MTAHAKGAYFTVVLVSATGIPTGETCPAFDGGAPTELKDGIIKKPAFF